MSIETPVEVVEEPIEITLVEGNPTTTVTEEITEVTVDTDDTTEVIISADTEINILEENTEVIVDAYADPIVNVYLGGIGGLPGVGSGDYEWFDVASFVQALNGSITKGQLSIDLSTQIDESTTGIAQANQDLAAAILNYEAGMQAIDAHDTRITTAEDNINLHSSRLNVAEGLIQTANVDITDLAVRTTVAEGSIGSHEARLVAQEELTSNEWTVKIQENVDGSVYTAGVGLLVYPDWDSGVAYAIDDFVYNGDIVYKATVAHVSDLTNEPPNTNFWEIIPNGVKSQFGVLADSFFVQSVTGSKEVPFLIQNGLVSIDGDLMASGTIRASALVAHDVVSWTSKSFNYSPGVSGWIIDANNNWAEFNDITMSWNKITGRPTSLTEISAAEATKLQGISAGADVTGSNVSLNTTNVGAYTAAVVSAYAVNPAARINAHTTTINGGKITTGSITALQIGANAITADKIAANAITAGKILAGEIVAGKLSVDSISTGNVKENHITKHYWVSAMDNDITFNAIFPYYNPVTGVAETKQIRIFILCAVTQSYISAITLTVAGVLRWTERPSAGTLACRGWSGLIPSNVDTQIKLYSDNLNNTNHVSVYALGLLR